MRIVWNDTESVFVAEFSDFTGDLAAVKAAGFRTHGAPQWMWYSPSPGVIALDRLRKYPPSSGLLITETALQKFNFLKEQFDKKKELKKTFKKLITAAQNDSVKRPTYEKDGFSSYSVEPIDTEFVMKYTIPKPLSDYCFVCGDVVYPPEQPDLCLWCSDKF